MPATAKGPRAGKSDDAESNQPLEDSLDVTPFPWPPVCHELTASIQLSRNVGFVNEPFRNDGRKY